MMTQTNLDRLKAYADAHAQLLTDNCSINPELYQTYGVKRGLRDQKGRGVLAGLTNISEIVSNKQVNGETVPCEGRLFYRGYDITDLVGAEAREHRFGFEEIAYLLLFGELPTREELAFFQRTLADSRTLPTNFVRDVIMKAPSRDMMNSLSRSVLTLASYDDNVSDVSLANVLRQCLMLIAVFPLLAVYGYHSYNHYERDESLYIHRPDDSLSAAENLLRMLRPDKSYTDLEARVLDLALILHMEHGGGNNSTFTTHVVTSSGSDTYSVVAAALASLKGPKHGGANIKVVEMMADLKQSLQNPHDEGQVADYLHKLLNREAFDRKGLIYGMGHAVYSYQRPARHHLPRLCGASGQGEGQGGGVRHLRHGRAHGPGDHLPRAQDLQGRQPQRGLLQRPDLQHAGHPGGAVHPHLRHRSHRGLERSPAGGADQHGQDHPPRLHERAGPARVRAHRRPGLRWLARIKTGKGPAESLPPGPCNINSGHPPFMPVLAGHECACH